MFAARSLVPERGLATHPSGCWRLVNIAGSEEEKHEKDDAPLKASATLKEVPGSPTLAEVLEELGGAAAKPGP